MSKTALKKRYPNRHKIIKILREEDCLMEIMSRRGTPICLNLMKHMLYQIPYKHLDYNSELIRFAQRNTGILKEIK